MARQGIKARTQGKASRQGIKASARQGRKASAIAIGMPSACHHRHRQLPSARHRSARHRSARHRSARHRSARHHRHRSSASRQGIIGKASASSASACRQGIGMPSRHRHAIIGMPSASAGRSNRTQDGRTKQQQRCSKVAQDFKEC